MKPEISAPSHPFAPRPLEMSGDDVLEETLHQYSHRFVLLGGVILLLLAVVFYLYENKVGEPMERMEGDVQTQVLTQPAPAELVTSAPVDEAPSQVNEAVAQGANPNLPWAEAVAAPTAVTAESQAPAYSGQGVQCPTGTSRMIYIGEQALCCKGDICTEVNG